MINEADILVNNVINVTSRRSQWFGQFGTVKKVMADGRTLEVLLDAPANHSTVFIDVTLVGEVRDAPTPPVGVEPNLGPDANSLLPVNRI